MALKILLDSGPLGEITHPRAERRAPVREWLTSLLDAGDHQLLQHGTWYAPGPKVLG